MKPEGFAYLHCPNYDRTFEERFMLEFGKPLRGNKEEFKRLVDSMSADSTEVDYINFINKKDVSDLIKKYGCEVIDLMQDNSLSDIDFIVRKKVQ